MSEQTRKRINELFAPGNLMCAESVVRVMAEAGGQDADVATRMATGLCSGAGRTCGQCGAVSGAIMGIGLYAGRSRGGQEYEPCYAMTQEFIARFENEFKSLNCFELTGCDFTTPEGQKKFKKDNLFEKCVGIASFAAEAAIALLRENGYLLTEDDFIKTQIAPCGLSCGKCLAFRNGPIQVHSKQLKEQLGDNFALYAKRFKGMHPVFKEYPTFENVLNFLASGSCSGCREQGCLFQACKVPDCIKAHDVDYCFQCAEFPCDHHGMPDGLAQRWQANNETMRQKGVGSWCIKTIDKPRYP